MIWKGEEGRGGYRERKRERGKEKEKDVEREEGRERDTTRAAESAIYTDQEQRRRLCGWSGV